MLKVTLAVFCEFHSQKSHILKRVKNSYEIRFS